MQSGLPSACNADTTRVIKVKCPRSPGSPATSDDFERAIKVRCSRPVSPVQGQRSLVSEPEPEPEPEPESKLRWSRPASPMQVSEMASKARQPSSTEASERSTESMSGTPISAAEALARAKEALARVHQMTDRVATATSRASTSTSSSADSSVDRWSLSPGSRILAPCLPAAEALAVAKNALANVHNMRPHGRPMPSTPRKRVPSRSLANTEVYVRATSSIDMPPPPPSPPHPLPSPPPALSALHIQHHRPFLENRVPIDTCGPKLVKNFSNDTADGVDTFTRGTMYFDVSRQEHRDALVVGRVILNESLNLDDKEVKKSAADMDEFIVKEKANKISKILLHGKRSKELLKVIIDFICREKAAIFAQGKKYFATKRKELGLPKLECIFCVRVATSTMDSDGITNWNSFGNDTNWKDGRLETHRNNCVLVTTGTNTVG